MRDTAESITKINDKLYLGGSHYMKGNHNTLLDQLEELGINSIINVAGGIDYPTTIRYRKFTWDDCNIPLFNFCKTNNVESNKTYPTVIEIENYLNHEIKKGQVVYVHCRMGISRSATLVIFHYIKRYDMSFFQAYTTIKELRASIRPNDHFTSQLMQYLQRYRRQKYRTSRRAACRQISALVTMTE